MSRNTTYDNNVSEGAGTHRVIELRTKSRCEVSKGKNCFGE